MDQKSVKIEVWRAPGQVWRPLGPSWAIQRIFEGILDRLGGVLEASWAGKVANMAPTWPQVGSQLGAKMDKKSIQKSIKNRPKSRSGGLRGRFGGLLGRLGRSKGFLRASWIVLEAAWKRLGRKKWPTWLQLGSKLAARTEAKSVLGRPGGVLGASWRPHVADFMHF